MTYGPGDNEIDEIDLDGIFASILPGSEPVSDESPPTHNTHESEESNKVDDPFGL